MTNRGLLLLLPLFGACVMDPVWGEEPTRRDPIDFSGVASKANALLRIQAWNYGTRTFDTLATFRGSSTQVASAPNIFAWTGIGVTIADRYWMPPIGDCTGGGMADLRVQEVNGDGTFTDLATFNAAGKDCVYDHIADGDHPVAAGNACKRTDETIVLFSPPQCVLPRTVDATGPVVTIRLNNTASAWQATSGGADLDVPFVPRTMALAATAMVRDRDGAVSRAQLLGDANVVCKRTSDGTFLLLPQPIGATATQTITAGTFAQISVDAVRTIDVPHLVSGVCPPGWVFDHVNGTVFATGTNAAGTIVTSPQIHFTI